MAHRALGVFAACTLTTVVAAAGNPRPNDASGLQGVWQAVEAEGGGKKLAAEQVGELQVVIKGDRLEIKPDGEGRKTTFQSDAGKTPSTIDLTPLDGARKGTVVPGIYSVERDRLRLCINIWGKDPARRPTAFTTEAGDGFVSVTLRRAQRD